MGYLKSQTCKQLHSGDGITEVDVPKHTLSDGANKLVIFCGADLRVPSLDRIQRKLETTLDGQGTTKNKEDQGIEDSGNQCGQEDLEGIVTFSIITDGTTIGGGTYRSQVQKRLNLWITQRDATDGPVSAVHRACAKG